MTGGVRQALVDLMPTFVLTRGRTFVAAARGEGGLDMEKGMAGDRPATQAATPSMATVERSAEGRDTTPMKVRPTGSGGPASGSITHPGDDATPQVRLARNADGSWLLSSQSSGRSWQWDADGHVWRGQAGAEDMEGPGPEDSAYWLSGRPNLPL